MIHIVDSHLGIITNQNLIIDCGKIFAHAKNKKMTPLEISVDRIHAKPLDTIDVKSSRFELADIKYPGIVVRVDGDDKYIMIDGRHRLKKLLLSNEERMQCYVFRKDDVLRFVELM